MGLKRELTRLFSAYVEPSDPEKADKASFIHGAFLAAMVVIALRVLLAGDFGHSEQILSLLFGLFCFLLVFLRRGRVHLSAVIAVIVSWFSMTWIAWVGQGIVDGAVASYSVLILIAGLLRDTKFTLSIGGMSIVSVFLMAYGSEAGWIVAEGESSYVLAGDLCAVLSLCVAVVLLYARSAVDNEERLVAELEERRKAEKRLSRIETLNRSLLESLPQRVFVKDANSVFRACNESFARDLGIRPEEIEGKTDDDFFPRELAERYRADDDKVVSRGVATVMEEPYELSGKERWVRVIKAPYCDGGGKAVGVVGIFEDITERRIAEEELRDTQQRILLHRDQTPLGVIEWDLDLRVKFWNPAAERIFGYTPEEAIGRHAMDLILTEDLRKQVEKIWAGLLQRKGGSRSTNENVAKDGSVLLCEWFNTPLVDSSGNVVGVASLVQDITEQRRMESQLRQAQKMEAVGQLAGGVAHDFNNLLQAIMGYAEMLLLRTSEEDSRHADLAEILNTGKRASNLTRQLLAFARKQRVLPVVLDLNDVIDGMLKMLRRLIGENIALEWSPRDGIWQLRVDPSQVDQILANLVVNARDAIGDVGTVRISVDNFVVDEAFCEKNPEAGVGEYVRLSVSDDGCGMEEGALARIFEPFFSTKDRGQGTGMGLATVYGIVRQNGGFVDVESSPGVGSSFYVFLPRHEASSNAEDVSLDSEAALPQEAGATVLIVEDEPGILELGKRMLSQLGYHVLSAETPAEALGIAGEHSGVIDLLLSDVILPEMSGRDLADRLLKTRPDMKLLFMSGYAADVVSQHLVLEDDADFLQKPFSIESLASKIQQVLREQ